MTTQIENPPDRTEQADEASEMSSLAGPAGQAEQPVSATVFPAGRVPAKLFAALAKLQAKTVEAPHDSVNQYHRFPYTSAEALIDAWKQIVPGTGIALLPGGPTFRPAKVGPSGVAGAPWLVRDIHVCHESGDFFTVHIEWPIIQEKGKTVAVSVSIAMTASLGYLIRDLALIPRPDQPREEPPPLRPTGPAPTPPPGGSRTAQAAPAGGTFASANVVAAMKDKAKRAGIKTAADMRAFMQDCLHFEIGSIEQVTDAEAGVVIAKFDALISGQAGGGGAAQG